MDPFPSYDVDCMILDKSSKLFLLLVFPLVLECSMYATWIAGRFFSS